MFWHRELTRIRSALRRERCAGQTRQPPPLIENEETLDCKPNWCLVRSGEPQTLEGTVYNEIVRRWSKRAQGDRGAA